MGVEITDARVLPAEGDERDALVEVMASAITDAADIDAGDLASLADERAADRIARMETVLHQASDTTTAIVDMPQSGRDTLRRVAITALLEADGEVFVGADH